MTSFSDATEWAAEVGTLKKPAAGDVARLARFDKDTFGVDAWLRMVWESEISQPDRTYLMLEAEPEPLRSVGRIVAVGGISHGPEAEVMTIGVHPDYRGRGIGAHLLENLLAIPQRRGADAVFLEVRSRGTAARSLYRKLGFTDVGRRKNYYSDDDAIVMKLDLTQSRAKTPDAPAGD